MKTLTVKTCIFIILFALLCDISNSRRSSGGRSRGSSSGSSGWWSRRKSSGSRRSSSSSSRASSNVQYKSVANIEQLVAKPATAKAKPSAPVETPVKKETSKIQQSSPNEPQPPHARWYVPAQNNAPGANTGGWQSEYQTHGAPPAYPHHNAAPPSYNGQLSWGAPPAYSGYGQSSWGAPPGYPGHAPSGYGGYGHSNPSGYGGFGHSNPQTGRYGGHGGYPQQSFGGYKPGYRRVSTAGMRMVVFGNRGGFGSVSGFGGGFGGSGYGGRNGSEYYPMKKKSFISVNTIGSVVAGMLVYNLASSLISHGLGLRSPYTVVNYYNQEPNQKVEEIKLPSNVLTLCKGNATQLCGQGTQSICTQNGTVLCVAAMNQAAPCHQGGNSALCVITTMPCMDATDPLCQNSTKKDKLEVDVKVPCFTNLTLDVNLMDKSQTLPNTQYTYCVTTMAIAGPEYKLCEDLTNTNDYKSVLNGNRTWFLETDGFRRNYSIYNYDRPMETNGEINMPLTVLVKCSDNAMKICAPGTIPTCTTLNEIMCMVLTIDTQQCSEKNSTCAKSKLLCSESTTDSFCQNKTEGNHNVTIELPCFANITINESIPKFNHAKYNGNLPDLNTYQFNYCVVTLALPGSDLDLCITKEAKEKQEKNETK